MEEDLESLETRHKKEQRGLVAHVTSLKKSVSKGEKAKRKEVLAEAEKLETALKKRHETERFQFLVKANEADKELKTEVNGDGITKSKINQSMQSLTLDELPNADNLAQNGKPKVNRQKARLVIIY